MTFKRINSPYEIIAHPLQTRVDAFLRALSVTNHAVRIKIVSDPSVSAETSAFCVSNFALGEIRINKRLTNPATYPFLNSDELDFVLAHEVSHIFMNHTPKSILAHLPKSILDAAAEVYEEALWLKLMVDAAYVIITLSGELPPEAQLTKEQEVDADILAIWLIGNRRTTAISALTKLVDGDLNRESHTWELLQLVNLPIMTMGQRIEKIMHATQQLAQFRGYLYR